MISNEEKTKQTIVIPSNPFIPILTLTCPLGTLQMTTAMHQHTQSNNSYHREIAGLCLASKCDFGGRMLVLAERKRRIYRSGREQVSHEPVLIGPSRRIASPPHFHVRRASCMHAVRADINSFSK